jgi:ribonuclease Z
MIPFELTILGCGSASPAKERNPTAQYLKWADRCFLLDCGEGTQMRMLQYGLKSSRIEHIYITHLHGDHFFGLIGLLTTFGMLKRTAPLKIFGPPGLAAIIELQLELTGSVLSYTLEFITWESVFAKVFEDEHLEVYTIPLSHRTPTCGYLFQEKPGQRKLIRHKVESLNIPINQLASIKAGADFIGSDGFCHSNATLTEAPRAPRRFAFITDTVYLPNIAPLIGDVDLLYHESTFNNANADKAISTFHSTAEQAASIAASAGAKRLLIGHFSAKLKKDDLENLLSEATSVFPNTVLAEEGMKLEF